jgi:AcrR family transcriptional regulator
VPRRAALNPPRQARSRETLRRLLDAAEKVIERHGVEGATLPRIARQARVSPANVYRRFRDKDALIAAVFSRLSDLQAEHADQPLDTQAIQGMGLRRFVRQWIGALVASYRARVGLMRATIEYSRKNAERPFVRRQVELEGRSFGKMAEALLLFRDEIRHPRPELAVRWAMLMPGFALKELLLFDRAGLTSRLLPLDDKTLREELVRAFLGYLDVDPEDQWSIRTTPGRGPV